MKHISIRVPWHDHKWDGRVCQNPGENPFCRTLPHIAELKTDDGEHRQAGKNWCELCPDNLPACKGENGAFMNPNAFTRRMTHAYAEYRNYPHWNLLPVYLEYPPYSFAGMPFRYMSNDCRAELNQRCPNLPSDEYENRTWVYGAERQAGILNWFSTEISSKGSLVVFYCKNSNPVDEDSRRMIVGLGEVSRKHGVMWYESKTDEPYPMWELLMEHSIRPNLKESRGFLLPYHEYLALDEDFIKDKTGLSKNEALDAIKLSLDKLGNGQRIFNELSYGCEYVSNHSMLIILEAAAECLKAVKKHALIGGDWQLQLRWIDAQIAKVKSQMGPFPSFAACVRSLGVNYAYLIEQDLRKQGYLAPKDNPWDAFEKLLNGDIPLDDSVYSAEIPSYRSMWLYIDPKQREVLELLSRFELDEDVISRWLDRHSQYDALLENPYIISEECNPADPGYISTPMIDLGIIPDVDIQGNWLPNSPSRVDTKIDNRRIRSLAVYYLKERLSSGDTLLSLNEVTSLIEENLMDESLKLPMNYLVNNKPFMEHQFSYIANEDGSQLSLQLHYYQKIETFLSKRFKARASKTVKTPLIEDWSQIVKSSIKEFDESNKRSCNAISDQIKALDTISTKRLSVLTGPAGTGKTTVVEAFLKSNQIQAEGVLLLAPTGKARVRLGNMAPGITAYTIAQFLVRQGFFDGENMRPFVPADVDNRKYAKAKNIIIDECSMLTTNDFYVLFNALDLKYVERIILIGDPYQLPPIGEGRTFADLYNFLNESFDENLRTSVAHLRTVVRTISTRESDALTLASWFSGTKPLKDTDSIFEKIERGDLKGDLRVYTWANGSELKAKMEEVLLNELPDERASLSDRILSSMGLDKLDDAANNPEVVERFQVLSPVINPMWGTFEINNHFQKWTGHDNRKYTIEIGPEFIHFGDKVMQLINQKRKASPAKEEMQLSNGQIGFMRFTHPYPGKYSKKKDGQVAFSGIPGQLFTYNESKSEDKDAVIQLAYAITIHKSQGSDFNMVLVVLPKTGRILSKELIYTALTRAKSKLILLVEDSPAWLFEYTKSQNSVLSRRNTNLFKYAVREEKGTIPYVEGLIHKTKNGSLVRSKSEVIIANELLSRGIPFQYEHRLEENGRCCIPDFTFEDAAGDTIILEHLGMLDLPSYAEAWKKKLAFYHSIGFKEGENLFTTRDGVNGSIDSTEIQRVIDEIEELIL